MHGLALGRAEGWKGVYMGLVLSYMVGMCICVYECVGWYGQALGRGESTIVRSIEACCMSIKRDST